MIGAAPFGRAIVFNPNGESDSPAKAHAKYVANKPKPPLGDLAYVANGHAETSALFKLISARGDVDRRPPGNLLLALIEAIVRALIAAEQVRK